ncbi:MAG: DegV family protein [Meiothermus sp.]|nr:DegV family protein [Meiothermus sp.]
MKTTFVADSTLGLSPQEALEQGIYLVPQQIILDGKTYRDWLELTPDEVAAAQKSGSKVTTSQCAQADIQELYDSLLGQFDRVVSVHVSSRLSGTYSTAQAVAAGFGDRVKVLDSLSINGGVQFVLDEARRLLAAGAAWERLEESVAPLRGAMRGYVLPRTLEYLRRGGRISGLQHFIASLLKILPILEIKDGAVLPAERVRGWHHGIAQLVHRFHRDFPRGARVHLAHTYDQEAIEELRRAMKLEGVLLESTRPAGAAVMAHTGPGTVAVFAAPRSAV